MNADGEQSLCSSLCKEFLLDLFVMCGFLHSHQDYFFYGGRGLMLAAISQYIFVSL